MLLCDHTQMLGRIPVFRLITALIIGTATVLSQAEGAAVASSMEYRFAALRRSPLDLYEFLYRMPKGGDLHNHFEGAVYAESFIDGAAANRLCVDTGRLAIVAPPCTAPLVDATLAATDNNLRNMLIDSLSMRNFVAGKQSGHDHFFATFAKFGPWDKTGLIAEVIQRAADQNESYLELMAVYGGGPISLLGKAAGLDDDFDVTRKKLEAGGLSTEVKGLKERVDTIEQVRQETLHCARTADSPACRVKVNYVYSVLRESPKESVFAQVMAGFALAALDSRVVAVNFVQPEDGVTSMRDYNLQMRMVDYAHRLYPAVHITLHAGELAPGLVPPEGLSFHIHEAMERGHAERIGHGVDIMYEKDARGLLKQMRDRRVAVEINLTSNDVILGITGANHPFPVYRKAGVPVLLATDDEGVSRSQLTREYLRAVLTYNLTYSDLKELVRNSLEYSFASGKSFWEKPGVYRQPVRFCATGRRSPQCIEYLSHNPKATLEADLENRFAKFETGFY
jgi:adenosine deaminase